MKQLKQFPKIEQIYCNLLQNGIEEDQIEILIDQKAKKVNMLIKLNLVGGNPKEIWPFNSESPDYNIYVGLLCILSTTGNHISQSLIISPYVEQLLSPGMYFLLGLYFTFPQVI